MRPWAQIWTHSDAKEDKKKQTQERSDLAGALEKSGKKVEKEKDKDRKLNTKPSHPTDDYVGEYENPGYGIFTVKKDGDKLKAVFNSIENTVEHYHYDIFEMKNELMDISVKISFITDKKGNVLIDFIGRYENLQNDFNLICVKLNIQHLKLPMINKSRKREHKNYREYYDDQSKAIVTELYKKDLEYFNYNF